MREVRGDTGGSGVVRWKREGWGWGRSGTASPVHILGGWHRADAVLHAGTPTGLVWGTCRGHQYLSAGGWGQTTSSLLWGRGSPSPGTSPCGMGTAVTPRGGQEHILDGELPLPQPGGGSIPPASPVGPREGQGTIAGVLSATCRVTADTQDGRARCRAGVCGRRCLQCHIGVGGGQLLVQGHVGPGRGVSEGGRGCTAQRGGEGPPRPPAAVETVCRSSGCSPLAKATTSQTASEALACRSKTQRGLSSAKVVAVTFPGSAVGGTQGT